jgi:hypothetical protein
MVDLRHLKINKQFNPVKSFEAFNKINVNNVLAIGSEEAAIIEYLFKLT